MCARSVGRSIVWPVTNLIHQIETINAVTHILSNDNDDDGRVRTQLNVTIVV